MQWEILPSETGEKVNEQVRDSLTSGTTGSGRRRRTPGQVLIIFALSLFVLFGAVGMSIDVGYYLSERRSVQNAADAAAMAAGKELIRRESQATAEAAAINYAELNNYGPSQGDVVSVTFPSEDRVNVEITHDVQKFFMQVLYDGPWDVTASASALANDIPEPYALIALGEDSDGVVFQGNSDIDIEGSVGSNSDITFNTSGGGSLSGTVNGNLGAYGAVGTPPGGFNVSGWRDGDQGIIENPLGAPTPPPCASMPPGQRIDDPHSSHGSVLSPGVYGGSGGGELPQGGSQNRRVRLLPGIYCIKDTLHINSESNPEGGLRSVNADYISNGLVAPADGGPAGGVVLYFYENGSLSLNSANFRIRAIGLSDETSTYCGSTDACDLNIAVWMAGPDCREFAINANKQNIIWGHVYAPCSFVDLGGTSGSEIHGLGIGHNIRIRGSSSLVLRPNIDDEGRMPLVNLVE